MLTAVGFFLARAHGESDARHDASHRADIAATQIQDRVAQATTLVDGVRRFLATPNAKGTTPSQFADIGARWLAPIGLSAAAWVERVPAAERSAYERRTRSRIVVPTANGLVREGSRKTYLPATLVTLAPPMSASGIDLGSIAGIASAVARPQTAFRVSATPLGRLADGTSGLFLVQSAQRLDSGVVDPGFLVLFVPASWLLAGPADSGAANPTVQVAVGGGSAGNLHGAASASSAFSAAGQRFVVRVPGGRVQGAAEAQPWIIAGAGVVLAVLAGALGLFATRRSAAKAEVDRLFNLSPDLIAVAGFDGYYKRVNPAFEAMLGYTQEEATAKRYVEFVHPEDRDATEARRGRLTEGEMNISFENRYVCKDGSIRSIEWTAVPVTKERLTYGVGRDVTERRRAESDLRDAEERNRALAEEQAALRRVATLVAQGVPPDELFAAVAEEVGRLLSVEYASLARYEPDATVRTMAFWGRLGRAFPAGGKHALGGRNVTTLVFETEQPARIDGYTDASGAIADVGRDFGIGSAVGTPIVVDGRLWGAIGAYSAPGMPLPVDAERRLANFSDLLATAVANADTRNEIAQLAEQQAALRRVATLVAQGVPPDELFTAVVEEVGQLLPVGSAAMGRYESDGTFTTVAAWSAGAIAFPVGRRWVPKGLNITTLVLETGRTARMDDFSGASGPVGIAAREAGYRSAVGTPIMVEGRLWGLITAASSSDEPLPADTEARLTSFTDLVATAIANADSRSELAASRARIVAASDETRRRIERDLHDGTQQRLVSLSLQLQLAESTVPAQLEETRTTIGNVAGELNHVIDELREISRGIHPAILSEGGLGPALRTLARRSAIPVVLGNAIEHRLPEAIEVAAYYVVSEALTNAVKHADGSYVAVDAAIDESGLHLSIRDDGVGGADPAGGSGLVGLRDRVEALGGSIDIDSPPKGGTHVSVRLPMAPEDVRPSPAHELRRRSDDADERDDRRASQPPSAR